MLSQTFFLLHCCSLIVVFDCILLFLDALHADTLFYFVDWRSYILYGFSFKQVILYFLKKDFLQIITFFFNLSSKLLQKKMAWNLNNLFFILGNIVSNLVVLEVPREEEFAALKNSSWFLFWFTRYFSCCSF